jgi:hypothetical protein
VAIMKERTRDQQREPRHHGRRHHCAQMRLSCGGFARQQHSKPEIEHHRENRCPGKGQRPAPEGVRPDATRHDNRGGEAQS